MHMAKQWKTLAVVASVLLLLLPGSLAQAQSMTVISGGDDARTCAFTAEMTARLNPSRGDLASCNRALEQEPLNRRDRAATFVNRGIVLAALDRFQDALNDYNSALEIQAELPQAFIGKGNLYYFAERYDDALVAYNTALEMNLDEKHVAYYDMGMAYEKLGNPEAAEQSYRTAIELSPDWTLPQQRLQRLLDQ